MVNPPNDDAIQHLEELQREVAARHHVILGQDDPIVVLQTCNEFLVRRTAAELEKAQRAALLDFQQSLELSSQRWSAESKALAERTLAAAVEESSGLVRQTAAELRAELVRGFSTTAKLEKRIRIQLCIIVAMGLALLCVFR